MNCVLDYISGSNSAKITLEKWLEDWNLSLQQDPTIKRFTMNSRYRANSAQSLPTVSGSVPRPHVKMGGNVWSNLTYKVNWHRSHTHYQWMHLKLEESYLVWNWFFFKILHLDILLVCKPAYDENNEKRRTNSQFWYKQKQIQRESNKRKKDKGWVLTV